jgi:hypothetical protein
LPSHEIRIRNLVLPRLRSGSKEDEEELMSATITTEKQIDASPSTVWKVLTDFASYPEWNPFLTSAVGSPVEGSKMKVRFEPPGGRGLNMSPTILSVVPEQELKWLGHFVVPGIFDGEHHFLIRDMGNGSTRFTQKEMFRGLLVPLTSNLLTKTKEGFEQMNQALKERSETSP